MTSNTRIMITLTSSLGVDEKYLELTRNVAATLAKENMGIVYGGTDYGMMSELAKSYKDSGGEDLVGVMAEDLMKVTKGYVAYKDLDEENIVPTMEDRKKVMVDKADGFLVLPGGYGTLEEMGTIIGGRVNKLFDKPIAIYNLDGFYDSLLEFLGELQGDKFTKIDYRDVVFVNDSIEDILEYYNNYQTSEVEDKFV